MRIVFTVPGRPVPKQRPRIVHGRTYTPKETTAYEAHVRVFALQAMAAAGIAGKPLEGRLRLRMTAFFDDRRNRDLDNVIKAVTDACNGVLFVDDRQIDELHAYRGHSPSPRCEVDIEDLPVPPRQPT
jgi:Holliday junction resolvase RusA-like endonuclease